MTGREAPRPLWAGRALALIGIVLVAFNLRTGVASLSPVLARVESEISLTPALVGFLGMLPPLCYALFGILTPLASRRLGLERSLVGALLLLCAGLAGRGLAPDAGWLIAASIAAFAAMGIGNVLLPPIVKRYFPDRIGLLTTIYATAMAVSTFVPPLVAVPVADASGWRVSLGEWAVLAALALGPWIVLLVRSQASQASPRRARGGRLEAAAPIGEMTAEASDSRGLLAAAARWPLAWALAVLFAVSGFNAYALFAWLPSILDDIAGTTPAQAGALLSLYAAMGLPASIVVPLLASRRGWIMPLVVVSVTVFVAGYLGLLLAPAQATWLWVALAGTGPMLFPLSLVLINLRTRSHEGAVALSGFVQSAGYLIVAAGPLAVGLLHQASGGWTLPLVVLLASALPAAIAGLVVRRPRTLEDARRP